MKDLESKIKNFIDEINSDTLKILKFGDMLPKVLQNFLIYEIARTVTLEEDISKNEIKKFYLKNNIKNRKTLSKILKAKGMLEEEFHFQITFPLKIYKLRLFF